LVGQFLYSNINVGIQEMEQKDEGFKPVSNAINAESEVPEDK